MRQFADFLPLAVGQAKKDILAVSLGVALERAATGDEERAVRQEAGERARDGDGHRLAALGVRPVDGDRQRGERAKRDNR